MRSPTQCELWTQPERVLAGGLASGFELLDTFEKDSHWWRYLLKCRGCGQRYVYEFYEEVDWADGEDPQYVTWVPVETDDDIAAVKAAAPGVLGAFVPRLCKDWPKGAAHATLHWVKSEQT
jgi:hypothetical protein